MENTLRVGIVSSMHGVKGEVKVYPTTDDTDRFNNLKTVLLDAKQGTLELKIKGVKFFKQMVILKFDGYDSRESVEAFKNCDLLVKREDAVPLKEGEYYICDIIGSDVITDEGEKLGVLKEVMKTGANDVYLVKSEDGKEILLPCINECILDIDTEKHVVKVHVMKGLIDDK